MTPQDQLKPQPVDMSLREYIDTYGEKIGVPKPLRDAIFQNESGFEHYDRTGRVKRSSAGALGVGQLMPATAKSLGVNPDDPIQNAYGALRLQKQLYDKYLKAQGDPKQAAILTAAAYNAGEKRVDDYNGVPPFAETQGYVKRVANHLKRNPISQRPLPQEPDRFLTQSQVTPKVNPPVPAYDTGVVPAQPTPQAPQPATPPIVSDDVLQQLAQQRIAQAQQRRVRQQMQARVQQARAARQVSQRPAQPDAAELARQIGGQVINPQPQGRFAGARVSGTPSQSDADKVRNVVRQTAPPGFSLLPESAQEYIGSTIGSAAGQLAKTVGGVGKSRLYVSPVTSATDYVLKKATGISPSEELSKTGQILSRGSQEMDLEANRGLVSQTVKDVVAGSIGSSPAMILMSLGVPAPVAFGLQSHLEAEGSDATFKDMIKETAKGATIGALFELSPFQKSGLIQRIAAKAGTVGAGTYAIERATGTPNQPAAINATVNALFAATGARKPESSLSRGLRRLEAREARGRETQLEPITTPRPETPPVAQPKAEAQAQAPEVGAVKPVVRHSDPRIDGGEIVGKTADGKLKVQNNEGGISVVQNPRTQGNREATIVKPALPALPELPETAPQEVRAARERQVTPTTPTVLPPVDFSGASDLITVDGKPMRPTVSMSRVEGGRWRIDGVKLTDDATGMRKQIPATRGNQTFPTEEEAHRYAIEQVRQTVGDKLPAAETPKQIAAPQPPSAPRVSTTPPAETAPPPPSTETPESPLVSKPVTPTTPEASRELPSSKLFTSPTAPQDRGIYQGKKFWIGTVNTLDGQIENVYSRQQAVEGENNHFKYMKPADVEGISSGERAMFWVDNKGEIQSQWRNKPISPELKAKVEGQINRAEVAPEVPKGEAKVETPVEVKPSAATRRAARVEKFAKSEKAKGELSVDFESASGDRRKVTVKSVRYDELPPEAQKMVDESLESDLRRDSVSAEFWSKVRQGKKPVTFVENVLGDQPPSYQLSRDTPTAEFERWASRDLYDAKFNPAAEQVRQSAQAKRQAAEAKAEQVRVAQETARAELRTRQEAYDAKLEAAQLPTGKRTKITLSKAKGDEDLPAREVDATVYGDWAIHKEEGKYVKSPYVITHVPTGLKAGEFESLAGAKRLIKGYREAGVDVSSRDLAKDKEALAKLARVHKYIVGGGEPPTAEVQAEPSTVTAARKRLAKTEKPNLKDFLKSEKGEFDPQVLMDHLIVHGYDAYQAGKVKFEDWSNEMRSRFKDFKEEIEPHLRDVYAKLTKSEPEVEAKSAPEEGIKERQLPKTLKAAEMETGNKPLYFPKSIIEGSQEGRKIVEEKGVDGAIEHVLHGEPGIDWASTGFATLNEMRRQETALRDSGDITAADALRQKKEEFAGNFSERATRLGQGIAGVKAIEEFAPDRAAYIANKASQKGRGKPLSIEEEQRITRAGERLGELKARERANGEAFAKAKAKASKPTVKRETYQDKLEAEAQRIVLTLKPKIGKLDLAPMLVKSGERGAVRTRIAPLEGDAELIAKYAASRLNKLDTVDALNKELVDMFGSELDPYLPSIRQRAYEIRGEARRAEIASRDTEPKQRRTILKEIQKEIADTRKSLEEGRVEQKAQATAELSVAKKGEAEGKAEFAREARKRLEQLREEYKAASKAEREGYRSVIKAQREAARKAQLWDTPLRDAASEAKTRLVNADPKSPDTMNDLVSVGVEKFLNEKIGGTGRVKPINPSQFYADLKSEYPDLVTKSNQAEIYKRSYERIKDAASAAREAAKQRTASAESQRLWDELGIDKDAQAILIERSEIARQQLEERTKMVREFNRVSQPLWKKGLFETQALARALKSSIDAPLGRQGLAISIMHPIETVRYTIPATLKGYSALRHGTYTDRVIEQQAHPDYDLGRRAGLDLTELASEHDPRIKAEEQFQSTLAEKIPHVRLSEQGFILGMNEQRLQAFSRFADAGRAQGYTWENNPKFFKEAAELINDMTGRGHMSENVQKFSSSVGNWLFYSTRLNVSRLQLLNDFLNPKKYVQYDPVTRKLMAQDLARLTIGMAGIYLGAKALGFGVTMNPNDPDFGKVRVGKTHYDVTGGEAGTIRYLWRLAAGTLKLGVGQPVAEQDSPYNISKKFFRQKLAPVPGTVVDYLSGSDITGQPKNLKFNQPQLVQRNILINMVTPMIVADMFDAYNEEGWKGVGKNVPGLAGIGVQNYMATPEVGEVRRQADVLNQTKKTTEGEFGEEIRRTKLGRSAAELNKMSAEAKAAPTTAERDKILTEMKRIAAQSLMPTAMEKERLSKIDPKVQTELKRLKTEGFTGEVNLPDNELKLGGKTIPLTDQQWEKYVVLFTGDYYRLASNVMNADNYKNTSDEIKRKRFDRARNIAHQMAKLKMKAELSQ